MMHAVTIQDISLQQLSLNWKYSNVHCYPYYTIWTLTSEDLCLQLDDKQFERIFCKICYLFHQTNNVCVASLLTFSEHFSHIPYYLTSPILYEINITIFYYMGSNSDSVTISLAIGIFSLEENISGPWFINKVRPDISKKYVSALNDPDLIPQYIYQCNSQYPR